MVVIVLKHIPVKNVLFKCLELHMLHPWLLYITIPGGEGVSVFRSDWSVVCSAPSAW